MDSMDKRYDHAAHEKRMQEKWDAEQTYKPDTQTGVLYSIDTPPPTVSGNLHIGHIFSYTHTDIIARFKRMAGHNVFYPFGFDDNGLPTERYVEKKQKIRAHMMPREEFIALCLAETKEAEKVFTDLWKRIGLSASWQHHYSTISESTRKISQASFIALHNNEHVYRKERPTPYCTTCRTSVAQAELDDQELPSFFSDIIFTGPDGEQLTIGTTRPELLPSCVALIAHPSDKRYTHLRGKKATTPIFGQEVPILEDEQVDPEKGTGLVMCCTFGDKTDISWWETLELPYKPSIGLDGTWLEHTGILAGLRVTDARKKILEELAAANLMPQQKKITHTVNTHERCGNPVELVALTQWFVAILPHKQKLIELADQINWRPAFMKPRYRDWVENISWDWCISRQRFYGVPFPVWYCKGCNNTILARLEDLPIDPQTAQPPIAQCACGSTEFRPETDVMDTWNTSSLTPYICAALYENKEPTFEGEKPPLLPMSMRPQAHDIIRTWAFDTIVKTWLHHKTIPWNDIVISGHVQDKGQKLSKSKANNPMAPERLLETYSADAIRYWTASGTLGHDVAFSEEQIRLGNRLVTKLWNAFRFIKEHITGAPPTDVEIGVGAVNEWILHQAHACFVGYKQYLDNYEFSLALDGVERFFWHDFCDNYLELIKDQLFNPDNYTAQEVAATRWTLHHVGSRILQLYAPYLPHITDALYNTLYYTDEMPSSIHLTRFEQAQPTYSFEDSANLVDNGLLPLVTQIRKLKSEHQLSLKTPLAQLTVVIDKQFISALEKHAQLIKAIAKADALVFAAEGAPTLLKQVGEQWHAHLNLTVEQQ